LEHLIFRNAKNDAKNIYNKSCFISFGLPKRGNARCCARTECCGANCHLQGDGFLDKNQFSIGIKKKLGNRQAMAIFNMGSHKSGFFLDGRAPLLRDQALKPIEDPLEMNETLPNASAKLTASKAYRDQFSRTFGDETVTAERIALAMEQFMFSIVSGNSKHDQVQQGKAQYTSEEARGKKLFFTEFDPTGKEKGAECFHCHAGPNFSNDQYQNNGLDLEANFKDMGRFAITGDASDKAKFKTPSLRNIVQTAPYMHNGCFKTLEEVIEHYNIHVKKSFNVR
jgi:cytochrome c peroxidase